MAGTKDKHFSESFGGVSIENGGKDEPTRLYFFDLERAKAFAKALATYARKVQRHDGLISIWLHEREDEKTSDSLLITAYIPADEKRIAKIKAAKAGK
jgi:hypothetical protein